MPQPLAITLHALGAEASADEGSAIDTESDDIGVTRAGARLELVVTEATEADKLQVAIDTSPDDSTGWRQVDSFEAVGAAEKLKLALHGLDRYIRCRWSGGAATFSVAGEAHQLFVSAEDVDAEVPSHALSKEIPANDMADALIKASDDIFGNLNSGYTPPILAVGDDVRQRGAEIAAWRAIKKRGLQPEGPDELVYDTAKDAEKWLIRVGQGKLRPPGIVDSTPTEYEGGAVVVSGPKRGW